MSETETRSKRETGAFWSPQFMFKLVGIIVMLVGAGSYFERRMTTLEVQMREILAREDKLEITVQEVSRTQMRLTRSVDRLEILIEKLENK